MDIHRRKVKELPYELTDKHKTSRVNLSQNHLNTILNMRYVSNIWTGDEIWIYYNNPVDYVWVGRDEEIPTSVKNNIGAKKVMISVYYWSSSGIKSITRLARDETFDKKFFTDTVLSDLKKKVGKVQTIVNGTWIIIITHRQRKSAQCECTN